MDNDGNITYWYLSESYEITSYNPINTDLAAKGAVRMAYHTTGENAGQWTFDDFTNEASAGENYLKNIRSCTRDKLYYKGYEVWPDDSEYRASLGGGTMLYNGVELPDIESVWTDKETYPYAVLLSYEGMTLLGLFSAETYVKSNMMAVPIGTSEALYMFDNGWNLTGEDVTDTEVSVVPSASFFWSNHDILNTDGTVYLAASEPVKP